MLTSNMVPTHNESFHRLLNITDAQCMQYVYDHFRDEWYYFQAPSFLSFIFIFTGDFDKKHNLLAMENSTDSSAMYQTKLREIDKKTENLIHKLETAEEGDFKQIGLLYHQIRLVIREGSYFPEELAQLSQWLNPSDPGYRPVSQFVEDIVHRAQETRRHVILVGTKEELELRYNAAHNLQMELEKRTQHLIDVFGDLEFDLCHLSTKEREEYGETMWWEVGGTQQPEWPIFTNWVYSFPETRRLMAAGRSLDDIAIDLLEGEEERFVDEPENTRTQTAL